MADRVVLGLLLLLAVVGDGRLVGFEAVGLGVDVVVGEFEASALASGVGVVVVEKGGRDSFGLLAGERLATRGLVAFLAGVVAHDCCDQQVFGQLVRRDVEQPHLDAAEREASFFLVLFVLGGFHEVHVLA